MDEAKLLAWDHNNDNDYRQKMSSIERVRFFHHEYLRRQADDGTFKKFSQKKDITRELYYNVYCGDVAEMIQKLPKKEYTLLIADIPYGFRMAGSSYDDEPFRFKQLEKMVKDFADLTTASLWRIVVFHSMDQGYSVAQALRSRCHGVENLAW